MASYTATAVPVPPGAVLSAVDFRFTASGYSLTGQGDGYLELTAPDGTPLDLILTVTATASDGSVVSGSTLPGQIHP